MLNEVDNIKFPEIGFLLTYGDSVLYEGRQNMGGAFRVFQAMMQFLHEVLVATNNNPDGAGSSKSEIHHQYIRRQNEVQISMHRDGNYQEPGEPLQNLNLSLAEVVAQGYNSLRFHLAGIASHSLPGVDYKAKILRFYNYYNPQKLVIVDKMLANARGFEELLLQSLISKYGPEPEEGRIDLRFRDRLTAFYHHYNPSRVQEVDGILMEYYGQEEQLFGALVAKYGPEPIIMGSEASSDDSLTFTNDTDKEHVDQYPLSVPLMPFVTPLHDYELPNLAEAQAEFSSDVHFWDNFVNQMPGDNEEEYGAGIDCNQELLQQYMRSYPVLFPHIVTASCPFKEQVFRGSNEFWQYVKARSEANAEDVEKADASHVVRAVSSFDPQSHPVFMTRREWQELVDDWEAAHGLERRVKVGSVALDADPNAGPRIVHAEPPMEPPPPPVATHQQQVQTAVDAPTQTYPSPPPTPIVVPVVSEPPPAPPTPEPEPVPEPPSPPSPKNYSRLAHVSGRALPVAWPVATLAKPPPPPEDRKPPETGDTTMEPYLKAALADVQRQRREPAAPARRAVVTIPTQTTGWAQPVQSHAVTRAGPSPRKVMEEPAPRVGAPPKHNDPFSGLGLGDLTMQRIRVTPSASEQDTDDFLEITDPKKYHKKYSPRRTHLTGSPGGHRLPAGPGPSPGPAQNRRGPHPAKQRAAAPAPTPVPGPGPSPAASKRRTRDTPSSHPSSGSDAVSRDRYWRSFLRQMESLTSEHQHQH